MTLYTLRRGVGPSTPGSSTAFFTGVWGVRCAGSVRPAGGADVVIDTRETKIDFGSGDWGLCKKVELRSGVPQWLWTSDLRGVRVSNRVLYPYLLL